MGDSMARGRISKHIEMRPWYVYALVDQATGKPFYIGITTNWENRRRQHLENPCVLALCKPMPTMECIKIIDNEKLARRFERYLIRKIPGLVNVSGVPKDKDYHRFSPTVAKLEKITETYQIVIE